MLIHHSNLFDLPVPTGGGFSLKELFITIRFSRAFDQQPTVERNVLELIEAHQASLK